MKISVVVPVYNEQELLESCISALLNQEYPRDQYEIILVDNNSTDNSAAIAQQFRDIRLVHEPSQGDFAARNRGIAESTGEIIAFTDADTSPRSNWLRSISRTMVDPEVQAVFGRLFFCSDSKWLNMLSAYDAEKTAYVYSQSEAELYFAFTCNLAVRRRAFDKLGYFPSVYRNADTVFLRLLIDAYSCSAATYDPEVAVDRMEIRNLREYFTKLHTYGVDFATYSTLSSVRALTTAERILVFRKTKDACRCSRLESMFLFLLLSMGGLSYDAGRYFGKRRRQRSTYTGQ